MTHSPHFAEIISISPNTLTVKISRTEACSNCAIKSACQLKADSQQIITIPTNSADKFHIGQIINLEISTQNGFSAVFYAYTIPLIIMLSTLLITLHQTNNELTSGIFSIFSIIPYYITLFFCQKRLNKKFSFKISEK